MLGGAARRQAEPKDPDAANQRRKQPPVAKTGCPEYLPGLPLRDSPFRSAGGTWDRLRGHPSSTTGPVLARGLPRPGGSWRLCRTRCTVEGAPCRTHSAGARIWAQGAFNTMDRSRRLRAPPAQPPAPGASCRSPYSRLLSRGVSTRAPSDPLSRVVSASVHLALGSPRSVLPKCKENAAGTEENLRRSRSRQPPLLPPPEPCHSSTGSALPNWGQPLSDCTIIFAAHPDAEMQAHSAASKESCPDLGVPQPGSGCEVVAEPRWFRGLTGLAWAREESKSSLRPEGSGNRIARVRAREEAAVALASSLRRRALQPWLKPTDENTERAAKSQ
ncbi:hypothetical protein TREES_T100005098 [Tupaia chinensis]|uniref:Uncharacterized protein n=1 Tax=Tupaia chinensis TaxID=246437 RepID=L9L0V8_TUPCH|nr:hypothetical protein TREES_T100005098 [Tupaia chinensis]